MRVPMQWLADYVAVELPVEELAHRLTMTGLKVETIDRIGEDWADVVIGEVLDVEPHPKSKKPLHLARVAVGDRVITVVTGAQNVFKGAKASVVLVGGILPHGPDGDPMRIQRRPMAGIDSEGMLASARELGISDEHEGIHILPPDAPAGASLRSYLGDDVLDIETNPNRPDTLSIIGIAREVAAITEQQLTLPDLDRITGAIEWVEQDSIPIEIRVPDLCPRFSAVRVEGVQPGESPSWLARRLQAAGMRPISLLVDLTNYVMLEYGQPMHAFDRTRLAGGRIVVRPAYPGEKLVTLDGLERTLSALDVVVADGERAAGIAGVMGGEESEIAADTMDLVLESANWDPISIRRTAKSLNLRSEASARFEKGLPPEQTVLGIRRFLQLLTQITDAPLRIFRLSDVSAAPQPPRRVTMPMRDLHRLIGVPVTFEQAEDALSLLGFGVRREADALEVKVPFWRRADIEVSADVVEEVARLVGFDEVPPTLMQHTMPAAALPGPLACEAVVRDRLIAGGASEVMTHSLTAPGHMARLAVENFNGQGDERFWASLIPNAAGVYARGAHVCPIEIANPATLDRQILRLTIVPSLLEVVARNLKHTDERLAFFELGRTFFAHPGNVELPYERRTLAIALSGRRRPVSWQNPRPGPHTFYDLKGLIEGVLAGLHVGDWTIEPATHPALHPGRAAVIRLARHDVAYLGELHPEAARRFDVDAWPAQVAELDLDTLMEHASGPGSFRPLPRYPAAHRDIAVIVAADVPAGDLLDAIRMAGDELLESASIFDVYRGAPLPEASKSIAFGLTFRAPGATLTQDEVTAALDRIVTALRERFGATLRE